jgi:hypothetical protein
MRRFGQPEDIAAVLLGIAAFPRKIGRFLLAAEYNVATALTVQLIDDVNFG